jgi:hypothetical protein
MAAVLEYTAENMIESFLEPVLELLGALIEFDRDALAGAARGARDAPQRVCGHGGGLRAAGWRSPGTPCPPQMRVVRP